MNCMFFVGYEDIVWLLWITQHSTQQIIVSDLRYDRKPSVKPVALVAIGVP
eukprot:IDg20597t1